MLLKDLDINTFDHYPIQINVTLSVTRKTQSKVQFTHNRKEEWNKFDKEI